eukprot:472090_1
MAAAERQGEIVSCVHKSMIRHKCHRTCTTTNKGVGSVRVDFHYAPPIDCKPRTNDDDKATVDKDRYKKEIYIQGRNWWEQPSLLTVAGDVIDNESKKAGGGGRGRGGGGRGGR